MRIEMDGRRALATALIALGGLLMAYVVLLALVDPSLSSAQTGTTRGTTGQTDDSAGTGDDDCLGAVEVVSVGPETESSLTPFSVEGTTMRVIYDATINDDFGFVDIAVLDEFGQVDSENIGDTSAGDFVVLEGPGGFELEVEVDGDAEYTVTVEDCRGDDNGDDDNDDNNVDDGIVFDDQSGDGKVIVETNRNDDQSDDAEVIVETIPDKGLPNTGGIAPVAGVVAVVALFLSIAALSARYGAGRRRP